MFQVTRADEGDYRCIAVLTGVNEYTIGTSQPPTRISLPIPLLVTDQCKYQHRAHHIPLSLTSPPPPIASTTHISPTSLLIPLLTRDQQVVTYSGQPLPTLYLSADDAGPE